MWTVEQDNFLRENYLKTSGTKIAKILGKKDSTVYFRAKKLGLRKRLLEKFSNVIDMPMNQRYSAIKILLILARANLHSEKTGERANISLKKLREAYSVYEVYVL